MASLFPLKNRFLACLFLFVCAGLVASAGPAFAGRYQRTLDKKSTIWNDDPKPWEECNWSGGRDRLNLATGPGTLTWYNDEKGPTTRTRFTAERLHFVSKLTGTMLRGRWEGIVEGVDANGRTTHSLFDNGKLMQPWTDGPAPAQAKAAEAAKAERKESPTPENTVTFAEAPPAPTISQSAPEPVRSVTKLASDPVPAATRVPSEFSIEPKPLVQNSSTVVARATPVPTKSMLASPPPAPSSGGSLLSDPVMAPANSNGGTGDLFHSLAAPPTLLQHRAVLVPKEVTKIAEAELARQGLKLTDYPRRQLTYNPDNDTWFVSYEHGASNESAAGPARVSVTVDDKTGNAISAH